MRHPYLPSMIGLTPGSYRSAAATTRNFRRAHSPAGPAPHKHLDRDLSSRSLAHRQMLFAHTNLNDTRLVHSS